MGKLKWVCVIVIRSGICYNFSVIESGRFILR